MEGLIVDQQGQDDDELGQEEQKVENTGMLAMEEVIEPEESQCQQTEDIAGSLTEV